jgi:hypothetical protein
VFITASRVDCHQDEPPVEGQQVEPVREAIHRFGLSIFTFHRQKHTKAHQQTLGARTRTGIKEKEHRRPDNGGWAGEREE